MTTSFLGIPVTGEIVRAETRRNQRPLEELAPLIEAVLGDPHISEFGWTQYTPYFNDGEPCIFRAYAAWFRTSDPADDDLSTDELDLSSTEGALNVMDYDHEKRAYVRRPGLEQWKYDTYDRAMALYAAIDGAQFDNVLLEAFGDHADITVRRDGIRIGFYEHD